MKLEKFHEWLQLNKNSKKTVTTYYQQVNYFGKQYDYNFNQENLNKYMIKLKEEDKSPSTINLFHNAMMNYSEFSKIKFDFPKWQKSKKRSIKFYFAEEDMKKVYNLLSLITPDYKLKELVLRFMFYTGARISEITNLRKKDIKFDKKEIIFYSAKGNKDRMVPFLNNKLYNDLKNHCENIDDKVFDVTRVKIYNLLKSLKTELQIDEDEKVETRTMRISFAKYCLSVGMDISYLKKLMGHTSIEITELYAEPDEKMIKEFCEKIRKENNGF